VEKIGGVSEEVIVSGPFGREGVSKTALRETKNVAESIDAGSTEPPSLARHFDSSHGCVRRLQRYDSFSHGNVNQTRNLVGVEFLHEVDTMTRDGSG
jgi:hypothetical protein